VSGPIHPAGRESWQVPEFETAFWLGRSCDACVIIPVMNEGGRITRLLGRMQALGINRVADVLVVDGGSTDGSLVAEDLRRLGVCGLLTKTGAGWLGAQLRCGYAFAIDQGYGCVVTIDGNDKDDPAAIPEFVDALSGGVDFVQGSRFVAGGLAANTPLARYLAIRLVHAPLVSLSSGFRWTDTTQGFRGYSRRLLLDPRIAPFRDVFAGYELLAYLSVRAPQLGYHCAELPTARRYPGGEVPTKISAFRGNLSLFVVLVRACLGHYDPVS
jgi:glycosyltransferase involved in cell wall biosynthesis